MRSNDSDSDSDGGTSYWKKLPVDIESLTQSPGKSPQSRLSQRKSRRVSRMESKRDSAWARPYIEDVYQNMEEFFPDHDIDKPIIGAGVPEPNRAKRKTIRMVAEERLQVDRNASTDTVRMRRRGTKLWGSHVHEVKAPETPTLL